MSETGEYLKPGTLLRPFPEPGAVFVADQVGLARHLHPLVSVDLAGVNPSWSGWAHLLSPVEPCDGLLGERTSAFHNKHLRRNRLVFSMEGDRYRLLGDPRYFLLENPRETLPPDIQLDHDALADHSIEAEREYRRSKASYAKRGLLHWIGEDGKIAADGQAFPLVSEVGGVVGYANWCVTADFPLDHVPFAFGELEPTEVWPLSPAGRRYQHVATTKGYPYRQHGADSIVLFYEPVEKLAMLTFDWS